MPGANEHEIDAGLRAMAKRAIARENGAVDVEADLVAARDRATNSSLARVRAEPSIRGWLAAAAAVVLIAATATAIVLAQAGDDGEIQTAVVDTAVRTSPVPAPTTTGFLMPSTSFAMVDSTVQSTTPTVATTTTSAAPRALTMATIEPAIVGGGELVTLRPAGAITRNCDGMLRYAVSRAATLEQLGASYPDFGYSPHSSFDYPCEHEVSDAEVDLRVPVELEPGEYAICAGELSAAAGCGTLTIGDRVSGSATCTAEPIAPPTLWDGSVPGVAVQVESDADTAEVEWDSGRLAIRQRVGVPPIPADFASSHARMRLLASGRYEAMVAPVDDTAESSIAVHIRGGDGFCPRTYLLSDALDLFQARLLTHHWLAFYADGVPVPTGLDQTVTAPVEYFGVNNQSNVHRFAENGSDLGGVEEPSPHLLRDRQAVALADGRILALSTHPGAELIRCVNRTLTVVTSEGELPVHPELVGVTSFAALPDGYLVASREMCPDGLGWGEPGTTWQLVALDLGVEDPQPEVLWERPLAEASGPFGSAVLTSISSDRRYVGLATDTTVHDSAIEIIDLGGGFSPVSLPSSCPSATDLASRPRFVGDGVVVARLCPVALGVDELVADHVMLPSRRLSWGAIVAMPMLGYGNTVGLTVSVDDEGRLTSAVVVGLATVEEPNISVLMIGDQQAVISQEPFNVMFFEPGF